MATFEDIKSYYVNILQRDPSDDEVRSWEAPVNAGALTIDQVRQAFINSSEAQNVAGVIRVYQAAFGRVPDQEGLKNWANSGLSMDQIAEGFVNSEEFTNRYGSKNVTEAFVTSLYFQVLGRAPDAEGLANWTNSGLSAAQILAGFSESQEFKNTTATAVSTFLDDAGKGTQDYSGKLIEDAPGGEEPEVPGQTFTLTKEVDSFAGTNGNDVISGVFGTAATATLTAGDDINGGDGVNTLNLTSIGTTSSDAVGIKNIDVLNVKVANAGGATVDAVLFENVGKISSSSSIGNLTINNLQSLETVIAVEKSAKNVTADFEAAAGGTADTVQVSVSDAGKKVGDTITYSKVDVASNNTIEAVTVHAASGVSYLELEAGSGNKTITIDDEGDLTLKTDDAITKVDASAATGFLTLDLSNAVSSVNVTGGNNDDVIILGSNFTSTDVVNGGDSTDKLTASIGAGQVLAAVSNVEVVDIAFTGAGNYNASKTTGVNKFDVSGSTAAATVTNAAASVTDLVISETNASTLAFGYASGAAATLKMTIGESDEGKGVAVTVVGGTTVTNAKDVTVASIGDAANGTGTLNLGTIATALSLTTENKNADLTVGAVTASKLETLSLTAVAGDITVGALASAASLTSIAATATEEADLTIGAVGATAAAQKLSSVSVSGGDKSLVSVGAISAYDATAKASLLETVTVEVGANAGVTVDDITAANHTDGKGGDVTFTLRTGDNLAASTIGDILAKNLSVDLTVGNNGGTLTVDKLDAVENIASVNVTTGESSNVTITELGSINTDAIGDITVDVGAGSTVDITSAVKSTGSIGNVVASGKGHFNFDAAGDTIISVDSTKVEGGSTINLSGVTSLLGTKIDVGTGINLVTGTHGDDLIGLSTGTDTVKFIDANGSDDINGFLKGTDKLSFADMTGIADTVLNPAVAVAANATQLVNATDGAVYVFADGGDGAGTEVIANYTDLADVASFLTAALAGTSNEKHVSVINDLVADKTYAYYVDDANASPGIQASEIKLIGVITEKDGAALLTSDIA